MTETSRVEASRTTERSDRPTEIVVRLPNVGAWMRQQLPEEFFTHVRAARREQLLAMRSLIDAALERNERGTRGATRTRTEIAVE